MAELSCYNQTMVDDQSGNLDIVLVIPFLVAWLWTNIFTSLIWDFSYGEEKEHTYTWSPYFCKIIGEPFLCIGCISILYIANTTYMWLLIIPALSVSILDWAECQRNLVLYCCWYMCSSTTKLLHQGCWPWVSLSKATIVPILMALCLGSVEIAGKTWISRLFDLAAKFRSLFHILGQMYLEWLSLLAATRVIELKDTGYTREMENKFPK